MTRRVGRMSVPSGAALGSLLLASSLLAQPPTPNENPIEVVYSTNSSNDTILRLDFANGTSTIVNTDAGLRKGLEGLAVRDDGSALQLLVCDRVANEVLFYAGAAGAGQLITNEIKQPHSVSLDQAGNAFVVSATRREVWIIPRGGMLAGGYSKPVRIDKILPSSLLTDARIVPYNAGLFQNGDLLVLSRIPAAVYRYPPDPISPSGFGPRQVVIPTSAFPSPSTQPTGFTFSPSQGLLIGTQGGQILRYDASGQRVLPNFAAGFGKGLLKIEVGVQDGASRAFVTNPTAGGSIQRLLINADGTGTPDADVKDQVSQPGGVGMAAALSAPTPVGEDVVVTPAPQTQLTLDNVLTAGITTARIIEFEDNRGPLNGGNFFVDQSLKDFFQVGDPLRDDLPNVIVPAHVQAFKKNDPDTGTPTFLLAVLNTTATFARTLEVEYDEADQLGYEPACTDPDATRQPRTFYVPEVDPPQSEPALVEGPVFVDVTTGCGSNIGRGGNISLWLTARETDDTADAADFKLVNMDAALDFYPCIDSETRGALEAELQAATSAFNDYKGSGDPDDQAQAIAHLDAFIAVVEANPGAFASCAPINVGGELIARADSAKFMIAKVVVSEGEPFTILVGDNDGFGFGAAQVPDNAPLLNINLPEDRRSPEEAAATDGAQQTDFYSANFPPLPSNFDAIFPFAGTIATATLEIDMGGFQASQFGQLDVEFNGVPQPGLLNFQDGVFNTSVRQFPLSAAAIANANAAGEFRVTIKRGASSDAITFDYFELSGTKSP